jgi:GntR family transcriptional regulator
MVKAAIDLRSKTPIFRQLADQLRRQIAAGAVSADSQLPTVRQMAAELRVNFNTVARAYRILAADGMLSSQQGRGTFVLPVESRQARQRLRRRALRQLVRSFVDEAARLGGQPQEVADQTLQELRRWQDRGDIPREVRAESERLKKKV